MKGPARLAITILIPPAVGTLWYMGTCGLISIKPTRGAPTGLEWFQAFGLAGMAIVLSTLVVGLVYSITYELMIEPAIAWVREGFEEDRQLDASRHDPDQIAGSLSVADDQAGSLSTPTDR